jgi:hypothetical protein
MVGVLLLAAGAVGVSACAAFAQHAKTALDAISIACIFQSELTDEKALADACGIARELVPVVRKLIGQRDAAKRSGVTWSKP